MRVDDADCAQNNIKGEVDLLASVDSYEINFARNADRGALTVDNQKAMASVKFIFLKDDFCLSVVFDSPDLVSERSDGRLDFFLNRLNNSLNFFFLNFNLGWFGLSSSSLGG